ncbi:MAG: hypothetical protein PHP07_06285, partial [Eubacteriales bacterium]|nr:hypothetical protein [Eubacteriales bacterium]
MTDMRTETTKVLREAILRAFSDFPLVGLPGPEALETPPDATLGDYAFPCFRLSKTLRMAP